MIAAAPPFSLFTAYQFLSADRLVFSPESKMRPYPSCVYWRLCAYMMEMIATGFFFVYCVSNFEFWFLFKGALTNAWRRVTIQHLRRKEWGAVLSSDHIVWPCYLRRADHIVETAVCQFDHMWCLVCFLAASCVVFLCRQSDFEIHFRTSKRWPHIIFSDTDLTTFLTIVTSGVHGDKMSGEYEKAVFA